MSLEKVKIGFTTIDEPNAINMIDGDYNDRIIGLFVNMIGATNCNDDEQEEPECESGKLANAEETECEVIE